MGIFHAFTWNPQKSPNSIQLYNPLYPHANPWTVPMNPHKLFMVERGRLNLPKH